MRPRPFWLFVLLLACLSCRTSGLNDGDSGGGISAELDELIRRHEALGRFSGAVAVSVNGELLFARGYGFADRGSHLENTPDTRFNLASLTKQLTAAGILKLEAKGLLNVGDPVSRHLPDYPRPQGDQITIHDLLTHTSGIPGLWRLGDGLEEVEAGPDPISIDNLRAYFESRDLLFEPGERFRYSNSGYVLLAAIIEEVSGKPYDDYLVETLFEPLGMKSTGCKRTPDDARPYQGHPPDVEQAPLEHPSWSVGDGCAHSTVSDLVKWDAALGDDRLLPRAQREKLMAAQIEIRNGLDYSYGWFLSEIHGRSAVHHSGAGEGVVSEMFRFPEERLTIIALANYAPEIGINAPRAIVDQVAARYFGVAFEAPPVVVDPAPAELSQFVGSYTIGGDESFKIVDRDGRLWLDRIDTDRSIFDLGMLEDPGVLVRAKQSGLDAVRAGQESNFERIRLCESLREDLAPGELAEEWGDIFGGRGSLVEITSALVDRYPGDDTLIVMTRLLFEEGETFFSLDVTPDLDVCGWYSMDRAEFDIRSTVRRPTRVPLAPVNSTEFLADGFNYREKDLRLSFHPTNDGRGLDVKLVGVVEHSARRRHPPSEM